MGNCLRAGQEMYALAVKLFPICRSITGEGVRQTLEILSGALAEDGIELVTHEVPSGTRAFDWPVPKEWVIREAYIEDGSGNHVIDMAENNLHVMGYSAPVDQWVDLAELKDHIYTQPDQPDVIPYVTSYYKECYGFCMSEAQKNSLPEGRYHMYIDSQLIDGSLTYAEVVLPGATDDEILFTSYVCHPSMTNNECSGPVLLTELIRYVNALDHRKYTYRFLLNPETIGAITYLSRNHQHLKEHLKVGLVLSCVGDDGDYSLVHTRYGHTLTDRGLANILKSRRGYREYSFLCRGSDERQYNAPGIDLPVAGFCRSKYGTFPEYHTSADDMNFISPAGLQGSYDVLTQWIDAMEWNEHYRVTVLCEPQLGSRGLYPTVSQKGTYDAVFATVNLLAYADGRNGLFDISERIHVPVSRLVEVVKKLREKHLLEVVDGSVAF